MLQLVAADVHPPLYFMFLNRWMILVGESIYATRLLSTFFAILGLAITYPLGKRLMDSRSAIIALIWLGSSGLFVYYAREVRMYTLLFALATLSMWAYMRWLTAMYKNPRSSASIRVALITSASYTFSITALIYTHYAGFFLLISQFLHLCWVVFCGHFKRVYTDNNIDIWRSSINYERRNRVFDKNSVSKICHWMALIFIALLLYIPWLPALYQQIVANPDGPHALAFPTNWANTRWLFLVISSGAGWWLLAPLLLSQPIVDVFRGLFRVKGQTKYEVSAPTNRRSSAFTCAPFSLLILISLWIVISPLTMLAINKWLAPFYAIRYVIGVLSGAALLVAYGLRQIIWPPLSIAILGCFVYINLTAVNYLLPPKTPWENIMEQVLIERQPDEPSLIKIVEPGSMEAYYDRKLRMVDEQTIDLSGKRQFFVDVQRQVADLQHAPSVWVMMPSNVPETWTMLSALSNERAVGYRHHADYMLFYRFDRPSSMENAASSYQSPEAMLDFQFQDEYHDEHLRYLGQLFAQQSEVWGVNKLHSTTDSLSVVHTLERAGHLIPILRLQPSEDFCTVLSLETVTDVSDLYSYGLHLVDMSNRLIAQHDQGLGAHDAGKVIQLRPCLRLPMGIVEGEYYLHLVIYRRHDGNRMRIVEQGADWGNALIFEVVSITDE